MGNVFDSGSREARRLKHRKFGDRQPGDQCRLAGAGKVDRTYDSAEALDELGSASVSGKVDLASGAGVSSSPLTRWLHCHIEHDVRQDLTDRATQGGLICRYCRGQ